LVFILPFKKTNIFAIAYAFGVISIIAFVASFFLAFEKAKTIKVKFLSFPIFKVGLIYLVVQISISTILMIISTFFPLYTWIAVVPCVVVLAIVLIKTLTIDLSREKMANISVKQEINTAFIRGLQVNLDALSERVSENSIKLKLSKLSEAVKYSDPVSNIELTEIETRMEVIFNELKSAVYAGRYDIESQINELANLLSERNTKCKMSKLKIDGMGDARIASKT
jgi:hypothetical protein